MKLLTLNTHSLIEPAYEAKRDAFVEFIRKEQPDVFALQEVNQTAAAPLLGNAPAGYYPCPGNMVLLKADNHAAAVARMLEEAGCAYHWSWLPAKIGYDRYDEGMAVFSRAPITAAENLLLSQIDDYNNWKTRRALGICAGDVWYYAVHLGWWKDEEEPFADQWNILAAAAGAKPLAFLLGDFSGTFWRRQPVQNRWRSCWAISTVKPMCGVRATTSFCAAAGRIPTGWPGSGMTAIPSCRPLTAGGMLRTRLPKNALTRSGAPRRCRCTAAGWYSAENRSLGSPTMRAF